MSERAASDGAPIDSDEGPEFIPSHQTLALVQSAMEEQREATVTFDGPVLYIEYIDEEGGTAWTERWD